MSGGSLPAEGVRRGHPRPRPTRRFSQRPRSRRGNQLQHWRWNGGIPRSREPRRRSQPHDGERRRLRLGTRLMCSASPGTTCWFGGGGTGTPGTVPRRGHANVFKDDVSAVALAPGRARVHARYREPATPAHCGRSKRAFTLDTTAGRPSRAVRPWPCRPGTLPRQPKGGHDHQKSPRRSAVTRARSEAVGRTPIWPSHRTT